MKFSKPGIIILFIGVVIISGCEHEQYTRLNHNQWFKYQVDDTIIYKCQSKLKSDTFVIAKIENSFTVYDKINYEEYLLVEYIKTNPPYSNLHDIGFYRKKESIVLRMFNFWNTLNYNKIGPITYNLGNSSVEDVYPVSDYTADAIKETDIVTLYYCDIYGIIRYDQKNGEVFELQLDN